MSQIELITGLPNWRWKPHSAEEIALTGEELVEESDFVWQIGNVAVAGFIHTSLLTAPWMWFVLAEGIGLKDLIDFRALAREIPQGTLTCVDVNFPVSLKFAKFYGFEETGELIENNSRLYKVMRKI